MDESTTLAVLIAIVLFAAVEQTISGFGFALIMMPLATLMLGLKTAAPLVALAGLTLYTINLVRYRSSLNVNKVLGLGIAAALGVPLGIWGLVNLDENLIKFVLGFILIAHAIFSFTRPATALILSPRWVYLAGLAAGCLGGAYNTPGPPLVVYGTLRQWHRDEFRAVLQALFFFTGLVTVASHFFTQHFTPNILTLYFFTVPALIIGILGGSLIDRRINHETFRRIILAMIFVLGLSLILGGR